MSSGADCHFTEKELGEWYYSLQRWPYGETEEYDEFGPFPTFKRAYSNMHQRGNPGGFSFAVHPDHVHKYVNGNCVGCNGSAPLACGCPSEGGWHQYPCDEFVFNVRLRVTSSTLARSIESGVLDKAAEQYVIEQFAAELAREKQFQSK